VARDRIGVKDVLTELRKFHERHRVQLDSKAIAIVKALAYFISSRTAPSTMDPSGTTTRRLDVDARQPEDRQSMANWTARSLHVNKL
jgi:hypothetical protein